jgi:hypothetical protein
VPKATSITQTVGTYNRLILTTGGQDEVVICSNSNTTQLPRGMHQRGTHRTYELVGGDLLEDGAEVAGDVLAGADGEQEDEEHWHPHRPCNKHGVPEGLVCLGYCVCIARHLLKSSVIATALRSAQREDVGRGADAGRAMIANTVRTDLRRAGSKESPMQGLKAARGRGGPCMPEAL